MPARQMQKLVYIYFPRKQPLTWQLSTTMYSFHPIDVSGSAAHFYIFSVQACSAQLNRHFVAMTMSEWSNVASSRRVNTKQMQTLQMKTAVIVIQS